LTDEYINCFNNVECIYQKCPLYSKDKNGCFFEAMKGVKVAVTQPPAQQRTQATLPTATGSAPQGEDGVRLINTLRAGEKSSKQNLLCLKGELVFDPIQKDVDTTSGPSTVTSIILKDETGEAKISFWGDTGDTIMNFVKGDTLFFEGLYRVKEPYDGKPQVDGGKYYKATKIN